MKIVVDKLPDSVFDCPFYRLGENNRAFCRLDDETCSGFNCPYTITLGQIKSQRKAAYKMTPEKFKEKAQEIYDSGKGYAGEDGHLDMDQLMKECLDSLGYQEGTEILFSMKSIWYS